MSVRFGRYAVSLYPRARSVYVAKRIRPHAWAYVWVWNRDHRGRVPNVG